MFSSSRKGGGADAFENDPPFISKSTVDLLPILVNVLALNLVQLYYYQYILYYSTVDQIYAL